MSRQSFLSRCCLHVMKRAYRRSSADGRWAYFSAFRREMVWKRVEIEGCWDSTTSTSTGDERMRPMMALVTYNWTLSSLLVVVASRQSDQAAAA